MPRSAISSTASGGHTKPVTPSSMISGRPPTFDATTGTSHAIASSAARPKLSCADGSRNRSATDSHGTRSCCSPAKTTRRCRPVLARRAARCRRATGPSPMSTNRARNVLANQAEHLERHVHALDRAEIRDVHDQRVASIRRTEPRAQRRIGPPPVLRAVEEVGDDPNLVPDAEGRRSCRPSGSGTPR